MNEIKIITAGEKYIPGFHRCLDIVAREERYILLLEAPPLESTTDFVKKNIANKIPQCFALDGEDVVGWADIFPLTRKTIEHRGGLGMGVLPAYRGKGIGSFLLKETLRMARERGLEKVELEVYASNSQAQALYRKFGFEQEGYIRK